MGRPALEVADIFRDYGPAWRKANAGHVSLGQLKVMSEIEGCRTAALDGSIHTNATPYDSRREELSADLSLRSQLCDIHRDDIEFYARFAFHDF